MGIENKLEKIKEKISSKYKDCPIIILGVKELPKSSSIELAIESVSKEGFELIERKTFDFADKSITFNGIEVDISHQKLVIQNKMQIDVLKIGFKSEANVDHLFMKDVVLYLNDQNELDLLYAKGK